MTDALNTPPSTTDTVATQVDFSERWLFGTIGLFAVTEVAVLLAWLCT
jgi:hypothetical protein